MDRGREMWVLLMLAFAGADGAAHNATAAPVRLVSGPPEVVYSAVGCRLSLLFTLRFRSGTLWRGEMVMSEVMEDGTMRRMHACRADHTSGSLACFSLTSGAWTDFPLTAGLAARAVLPVTDRVEMADNGSVYEMWMEGWLRTRTMVVVDGGVRAGPRQGFKPVGWYFRIVGAACLAFTLLFVVVYHCIAWTERRRVRKGLDELEREMGKPPPSYTRLFPPAQPQNRDEPQTSGVVVVTTPDDVNAAGPKRPVAAVVVANDA